MLANLSSQEKSAVKRLLDSKDFTIFLNYLKTNLKDRDKYNRYQQDTTLLRQNQGITMCLDVILQNIEETQKL